MTQYAETRSPLRAAVLGAALLLAACGSSTPRQAEVKKPSEVVVPTVTTLAPAKAASAPNVVAAEPKADGKRRRDKRAEPETVAAIDAPIPEAAVAAYAHALAAVQAANWVQAELDLEQLSAQYPTYAGPQVNLAIVYMHDGRRDDARKALERALAIDPGHPAANNQLGILLREQGDFAAAERAYRHALDTNPSYGLAHYNLAVLLDIYMRRQAEALEQYQLYQSSLTAPDETVGRWIVDLQRRLGVNATTSRVAQEDGA